MSVVDVNNLITEHLDLWTTTLKSKATTGRGSSKKIELYGVNKLRELILDLAIKGKLVPQISSENQIVVPSKDKVNVSEKNKHPHQLKIPSNWTLCKLDDICSLTGGYAFKSSKYVNEGVRVIRISDFDETGFKNDKIVRYVDNPELDKFRLEKNNILMAMTGGTVGKSLLVSKLDELMVVNQRVATIKIGNYAEPKFIHSLIKSSTIQSIINIAKNSTNDNISMGQIAGFPIPLPPLEEQHRIVAKVDELMALCDELEAQTENSLSSHQTLVDTLLETLTNSADSDELTENWNRISEHFDTLFTTEKSIDSLEETILQLAVMGKLVPQDPSDEPASVLLERISVEKERLIQEKVIKKQKALPEIGEGEKPFELPDGWEWCRLEHITSRIGSGSTPRGGKSAYVESGVPFFRSQNIYNEYLKLEDVAFIPEVTHQKMSNTKVFAKDILLNITGASLGRCALMPDNFKEANVSQHVTIIRCVIPELRQYLHKLIISPFTQGMIWGRQVGMAREGLSKKVLEQFEIPLPSLAEQHRIVIKLEDFKNICNQLRSVIVERKGLLEKFTDSLILENNTDA